MFDFLIIIINLRLIAKLAMQGGIVY